MTPMSSSGDGSDLKLSKFFFADCSGAAQWLLDGFLKIDDFNQNASLLNNGLSKAHGAKLGGSICSLAIEGSLEANKCLDQMLDTFWVVPQITSQLIESELHLSKSCQNPSNYAIFVPDVSSPWFQISRLHQEPQPHGRAPRGGGNSDTSSKIFGFCLKTLCGGYMAFYDLSFLHHL